MRALIILTLLSSPALAGKDAFYAGEAISAFGPIASVETTASIPEDAAFKVRFDVAKQAEPGALNKTFESAARFINMHHQAGIDLENIDLAIVIHGGAVKDVANADRYAGVSSEANANAPLIAALQEKGVKFFVCGQSAAYYDVATSDLLPGVAMSLSAMTAHALLDSDGYALNPF